MGRHARGLALRHLAPFAAPAALARAAAELGRARAVAGAIERAQRLQARRTGEAAVAEADAIVAGAAAQAAVRAGAERAIGAAVRRAACARAAHAGAAVTTAIGAAGVGAVEADSALEADAYAVVAHAAAGAVVWACGGRVAGSSQRFGKERDGVGSERPPGGSRHFDDQTRTVWADTVGWSSLVLFLLAAKKDPVFAVTFRRFSKFGEPIGSPFCRGDDTNFT